MNLHAQWITGFVDGEGCFSVSIVKNEKTKYQVMPEFIITQHERDIQILYGLKSYFQCGIVKKNGPNSNCYVFVIRDYKLLSSRIIPFFEIHKLKTKKRIDFEKFRYVVNFMMEKKHLSLTGIEELQIFLKKWRSSKRKVEYKDQE
jgi:LAGLIDADG endonuclease